MQFSAHRTECRGGEAADAQDLRRVLSAKRAGSGRAGGGLLESEEVGSGRGNMGGKAGGAEACRGLLAVTAVQGWGSAQGTPALLHINRHSRKAITHIQTASVQT